MLARQAREQPRSYSSLPSAWSTEKRPAPLIRNTSATTPMSSEYSMPPDDQKKPPRWLVAQQALIMKMMTAAAAKRVKKPNTSISPPTNSVSATNDSQNTAGCQPILSKISVNFSKPAPPNQPNSFWQPCGIRIPPSTMRK